MSTPCQPIRVLLADDHPFLRRGFAMHMPPDVIDIVGETATPETTLIAYDELLPDVILLDIQFVEQMTGFDVALLLLKKHPNVKIVFLSQFDQISIIEEAYQIGARAFITKNCSPDILIESVQAVHAGHIFYMSGVQELLAQA